MGIINTNNLNLPSNAGRGEAPGAWHTLWNQICDSLEARVGKHDVVKPEIAAALLGQFFLRHDTEPDLYFATLVGDAGVATWQGFYHSSITRRGGRGFAYQVVASAAGVLIPSLALGNYFATTLTENTTIANPVGLVGGDLVVFDITQDAVTARTLSWGTAYKGMDSGTVPFASNARFLYVFVVANNGDLLLLQRVGSAPYSSLTKLVAEQLVNSGTTVAIDGFAGIGPVAGGQNFLAAGKATIRASGIGVVLNLHIGPLGTISDPIVASDLGTVDGTMSLTIPSWLFTSTVNDKITLSVTRSSGIFFILGQDTAPPFGGNSGTRTWLSLVSIP